MDHQSSSPVPSSRSDPYDGEIDLSRYTALLWRRRWAIAMFVLVCGAMGWLLPATTVATARLPIMDGLGAPVAADVVDLYLARARGASLPAHVVSELALDRPPYNMTLSQVQATLTFRVNSPGNVILVEARMRDPELAARAADSAARRAAEVDQQEFDESRRAVEEAEGALFWFDRTTMFPLIEDIEKLKEQRKLLTQVERSLVSLSAILLMAKQQAVELSDNKELAWRLADAVVSTQRELASLKAQRNHLEEAQKLGMSQMQELFRSEKERRQLEADLRSATSRHQPHAYLRIQAPGETVLAAGWPLNVAVGLAIGLFLSVTTMLFYDGLFADRVKWAEAGTIETSDQG